MILRHERVVAVLDTVSSDPVPSDVHHEDPDRAVHVSVILLEILIV